MIMNRYKVGDVINNFEIQGINTERRYVRYYCKCLLCGNNYLYPKYSLVRNKGNGCQRCSHRVDTNDIVGKTFNAWKVLKRLEKVQKECLWKDGERCKKKRTSTHSVLFLNFLKKFAKSVDK